MFNKGVNLGGWLSQCVHTKEHYDTFIVEEDFKRIKSLGFDHVRIPFDNDLVEDEKGNYTDGFKYLDMAITWAQKYDLKMILDLHKTYGYSFDDENSYGFFQSEKKKQRFLDLWVELSKRYCKFSSFLALELLNEVVEESVIAEWNALAMRAFKIVRSYSKDVKVIVGGVFNNSMFSLKYLPILDENTIYTFHCYEPILFTHQGAYWIKSMPSDYRMVYPVTGEKLFKDQDLLPSQNKVIYERFTAEELNGDFFEVIFKEALDFAEKNHVELYCGEYGVINLVCPTEALNWYRDINRSFVKHNIGRAVWNYKELDFGIIDDHYKEVFDELISYL